MSLLDTSKFFHPTASLKIIEMVLFLVSSYFGFGLMDAAALVNYSRSWRTVPKQIKCQITERNVHR